MENTDVSRGVDEQAEVSPLESMSSDQRDEYFKTGALPEPKEQKAEEKPAPSEDPKKGEKPAADDKKAESEPGTGTEKDSEPPKEAKAWAEMRRRVRASEQKVLEMENALAALRNAAKPRENPAGTPADNDPEPDPEKFEKYSDYLKDMTKWTLRQDRKAEAQAAAERQTREEHEKNTARARDWLERVAAATEKHADFEDVTDSEIPMSQDMARFVLENEQGAELLYFLGTNPEHAARIHELVPAAAKRELEKLVAGLNAPKEKPGEEPKKDAPKPKTVTDAKPPVTELTGGKPAPGNEVDAAVESGDFARYAALKNDEDLKRSRR